MVDVVADTILARETAVDSVLEVVVDIAVGADLDILDVGSRSERMRFEGAV